MEIANFPVGVHDDVCDGFFHAIKAFTTERDFKTPDLRVIPGRVQSEREQEEQELREQLEYESVDGAGDVNWVGNPPGKADLGQTPPAGSK
jgi:hypothetical protein